VRRPLIAGNWKMNLLKDEAEKLIDGVVRCAENSLHVDVLICPPYVLLERAVQLTGASKVCVGAQNAHHERNGAFTGEVSIPMLRSIGCTHVIIGHSERRTYFHETNEGANSKMRSALSGGMIPILCIGESLAQRRMGQTFSVLNDQLVYGLQGIGSADIHRTVIAYEPVWAIGTGLSATSEQAGETHRFIRQVIGSFSNTSVALEIRIIYGGSVNPSNVLALLDQDDVDGALVGGASLKAASFCEIVKTADAVKEGVA
jgi:triosephosphate isomerase